MPEVRDLNICNQREKTYSTRAKRQEARTGKKNTCVGRGKKHRQPGRTTYGSKWVSSVGETSASSRS
jgi:hypothetical protein